MEYLTEDEAAKIINPKYKQNSIAVSMSIHRKKGSIKQVFPNLAIVDDDGKVVRIIGKGLLPFYNKEEVELYARSKMKHWRNIKIKAIAEDGKEYCFDSIIQAAKGLEIEYYKLHRFINKGAGQGYKFLTD